MGDRANVQVIDEWEPTKSIFLYTHWAGSELPGIVQDAMKRGRDRWTDHSYLTRIIFCEMIRESLDELTGFGISAVVGDGEDRIVLIDTKNQKVTVTGWSDAPQIYSFDEFCKADVKRFATE